MVFTFKLFLLLTSKIFPISMQQLTQMTYNFMHAHVLFNHSILYFTTSSASFMHAPFLFLSYSSPFPIHLLPSSFTIHLIYHSNGRYSSTAVMMAATAGDPANAARTVQLLLTVVGDAILHFQVCCLFPSFLFIRGL